MKENINRIFVVFCIVCLGYIWSIEWEAAVFAFISVWVCAAVVIGVENIFEGHGGNVIVWGAIVLSLVGVPIDFFRLPVHIFWWTCAARYSFVKWVENKEEEERIFEREKTIQEQKQARLNAEKELKRSTTLSRVRHILSEFGGDGISEAVSELRKADAQYVYPDLRITATRLSVFNNERWDVMDKCFIMQENQYGEGVETLIEKLKSQGLKASEWMLTKLEGIYYKSNVEEKFQIDVKELLNTLWSLALNEEYNAEEINRAQVLCDFYLGIREKSEYGNRIITTKSVDSLCAELYTVKKLGYGDLLEQKQDEINKWLEVQVSRKNVDACTSLASCLCWMKLPELEKLVLEKMVLSGLSFNREMQRRLEYVKGISGNRGYYKGEEIITDLNVLGFEESSINWKDNEFEQFFKEVAYANEKREYSLAIREWREEIDCQQVPEIFDVPYLFTELRNILEPEYKNQIICTKETCERFIDTDTEKEDGILIKPVKETVGFDDIGLLLMFSSFGRNINIRIYTLYMPGGTDIQEQRRRVVKLKNSTNARMVDFENNIKKSMIHAIQDIANRKSSVMTENIGVGNVEF